MRESVLTDKLILHISEGTYFKLVVDQTFIYFIVREFDIDVWENSK